MSHCEDYPCCGHGPPPGDGGGCPDEEGRFNCVACGAKLAKGATSALCPGNDCISSLLQDEDALYDPYDPYEDDGFF